MGPYPHQLRDIHGLDAIPWWPLAPGWWLLALALVAGVWLAWRLLPWLPRDLSGRAWRWDAARRLRDLRRRVPRQEPRRTAEELSELLRRIAMARHGRAQCAGLTGADWLAWLAAHDPQGFDWSREARPLLDMPYAPPGRVEGQGAFLSLIDAALAWTVREPSSKREPKAHV